MILGKTKNSINIRNISSSKLLTKSPPGALYYNNNNSSINNMTRLNQLKYNNYSSFIPADKLSQKDLNQKAIETEYAVRGLIPIKAEELREKLKNHPDSLPFKEIINANIGNPQQLKQKPLTFYRSILSILQNPKLLESDEFSKDVKTRSKILLNKIGSLGAYSHSQGVPYIREQVAHFITKRDNGVPAHPENIYLTGGASDAVKSVFEVLLDGTKESGVLIPIPQYPLYTAQITLKNATPISYYLNESDNWSTNPEEIENLVLDSKKFGIKPKILVVINPGNPTGAILSKSHIEDILTIAAKYGIVVIADEVYQENIFEGKFHSFKEVLADLQNKHGDLYDNVQLVSLHSTSKGVTGECGQRGGYMECIGFKPEVHEIFLKLASISLCSVVSGQALVELMVNPPKKGDESYELDQKERLSLHESYKFKANSLYDKFSSLENIEVLKPQGAMYLFPQIFLTPGMINRAKELNLKPDEYYCLELLQHTGICVVPGSGFGQVEGTFHVRTTFLPPGDEWIDQWAQFHKDFFKKYHN
ncbi:putative alanine aminotransferase [Wickerhamomyces ciferrii]|uniref:Alanine aminotransferase n=1 Tax=Wickerhamomyces ciferrii (strain ATCC 14091 / BCRC 22168 / CBS 111 / JCM 3599 / NBRC 0793 / NRRL Y-1031 F-60-10) TaxID=1206466 RepID=K0KSH2_WICCF|nr:putative alanine aminotransferase [Wickerhamomyces ciferrii]CCH44269.1 putative alanine aminotransferase [Wickerhamomyces ciferrii]